MRIVQLANLYGDESGGLRVTVDRLRRSYHAAGIDTALVVPGPENDRRDTEWGPVFRIASPFLPASEKAYRVVVDRSALLGILERLRPDRIEVSDKLTMVAAARWGARRGIPSVLLSHERLDAILALRVPRRFPLQRCADRWNRRMARLFDVVVCPSRFSAAEFRRIGVEVVEIPLGVDLGVFRPRPSRAAASPGIRMVMVGRLSREKRPDLAIDALRTLQLWGVNARLTVVGGGPMREDLQRRSRGLRVDFLGHVADPGAVAGELAAADVALAPCPAESFGLAALEALACGTPVVASRRGAAPELIGPGAGLAVADGPRAVARGVVQLMQRPRTERETAARRSAERFPWERTVAGMLAVHRAARARVG